MQSKEYTIIKKSDWNITNWSGGTTSQLFIYPLDSNFKTGDYQLRISIATVEVETSTFTTLKDVNRTLLVLDGNLMLDHENQHTSNLKQYDQDSFSGNWNTSSIGKVRDFNVMTKGDTHSEVRVINVSKETMFAGLQNDFIHVLKGNLTIDGQIIGLNDSVQLSSKSMNLNLSLESRIVLVRTAY